MRGGVAVGCCGGGLGGCAHVLAGRDVGVSGAAVLPDGLLCCPPTGVPGGGVLGVAGVAGTSPVLRVVGVQAEADQLFAVAGVVICVDGGGQTLGAVAMGPVSAHAERLG